MTGPGNEEVRGIHAAHDQWDELAVGYALTALEPDELERFVEHLVAFCPQCQRSVDDTATVGAELGQALPGPIAAPSESLRNSVLSAAFAARPAVPQTTADLSAVRSISPAPASSSTSDVTPASSGTASGAHHVVDLSERRARRTARSAGWLVAAAAAVVALVLSVTTVAALHAKSRTSAEASQYQQAITASLTTPGRVVPLKSESGSNIASVVAHSDSVNVVSLSMTPNAKTSTYVLWGINGKTAGPVALGVFDINGTHVQTTQVATDSRGYGSFTQYAVSREPGRTPPKSPSTIVAEG